MRVPLVCCVCLALVLGVAPTRARPHEAAPRHPWPIVLVPGFLGFRSMGAFGPYWRGWREALESDGWEVFELSPTPVATSESRAHELMHAIDSVKRRTGAAQVIVIAHSQGGVDVREALRLGADKDIAAVATLSAPHHGTAVADRSLDSLPRPLVEAGLTMLQRMQQSENQRRYTKPDSALALGSLSRAARADLSAPASTVPFYSFAAVAGGDVDKSCGDAIWPEPKFDEPLAPPLVFGHVMIQTDGHISDDGVVPTSSMRWGTFVGCVPGTHAVWLGWDELWSPFKHLAFARALARVLERAALGDNVGALLDVRALAAIGQAQ